MLFQAQDQGLHFWQMKSNAIVVNDHVQANCIYRVTSPKGQHVLHEREPILRLAPKAILKSRWKVEQEQDAEDPCTDAWKNRKGTHSQFRKDMKIETLYEQCATSSWEHHVLTDFSKFEVDLRSHGVPDDTVQQDENHMKEINEKMEKLRIGSNAESIREDWSRENGDFTSSENSRRTIHEMGNVELFELGKTTSTLQCQSCYKHVLDGIIFCGCGYCLLSWWGHYWQGQSKTQNLDCTQVRSPHGKFKREETRRAPLAGTSLESQGRFQRCNEAPSFPGPG